MHQHLTTDLTHIDAVLEQAAALSRRFLQELHARPAGLAPTRHALLPLPERGCGAQAAMHTFAGRYYAELTASAGPRSFGYVVGGATPAAVAGDWLTAAFDQDNGEGVTAHLETEALAMLGQLFGLPDEHTGVLVSGATMANVAGLAAARQWLGARRGADVAQAGIAALGPVRILSGRPHSSISKALAMLGLGREALVAVPCARGTEAVDVSALRAALDRHAGEPCVVVGNAGTVNATSFDDFAELGKLKAEHGFWLHVDAAFGLFAACSPRYAHLVADIAVADSIAVDAHKWLNVPYDCGAVFTRHPELLREVFVNAHAAYLRESGEVTDYMNRTPETSRRLRALPMWMTLMAYGRDGYRELVERDCAAASALAARIEGSVLFRLLVPTALNVVCFTLRDRPERCRVLLDRLLADGRVFMTPTLHEGTPGMRAALCNWRTTAADVEIAWQALVECSASMGIEANQTS